MEACRFEWRATVSNRTRMSSGCPRCAESHGERAIAKLLTGWDVEFRRDIRFTGCRDRRLLPFDFAIDTLGLLIEFQGKQHDAPVGFFDGAVAYPQRLSRDAIKAAWTASNGWRQLTIRFDEDVSNALHRAIFSSPTEGSK